MAREERASATSAEHGAVGGIARRLHELKSSPQFKSVYGRRAEVARSCENESTRRIPRCSACSPPFSYSAGACARRTACGAVRACCCLFSRRGHVALMRERQCTMHPTARCSCKAGRQPTHGARLVNADGGGAQSPRRAGVNSRVGEREPMIPSDMPRLRLTSDTAYGFARSNNCCRGGDGRAR